MSGTPKFCLLVLEFDVCGIDLKMMRWYQVNSPSKGQGAMWPIHGSIGSANMKLHCKQRHQRVQNDQHAMLDVGVKPMKPNEWKPW